MFSCKFSKFNRQSSSTFATQKYSNVQLRGKMNTVTSWVRGGSASEFIRTALHHLCERLHGSLLRTLEAALCKEGAHHNLQGAPSGQVVVLCRAGSCLRTTPTLQKQALNNRLYVTAEGGIHQVSYHKAEETGSSQHWKKNTTKYKEYKNISDTMKPSTFTQVLK